MIDLIDARLAMFRAVSLVILVALLAVYAALRLDVVALPEEAGRADG